MEFGTGEGLHHGKGATIPGEIRGREFDAEIIQAARQLVAEEFTAQRLVKTGGRLIRHARYYWLLLAESHLTRRLFGSMVRRIAALPVPAG